MSSKCPNCGRATARTEDWACQWCGYPLLSGSYKKIPKTYKQIKEGRLMVGEETGAPPLSEESTLPPTRVPELKPELELELEPEPVSELEAELEPKREPVAEPEPVLESEVEPAPEIEEELEPEHEPILEAEPESELGREPVSELEQAPVSEAEPAPPAMEITVEELLSAYQMEGAAADARFADKILRLTGVVDRVEVRENLNIYYIVLTSAEGNPLQKVRCMFDRKNGAGISRLETGQTVTVQGEYDGSIIAIRMKGCILVS